MADVGGGEDDKDEGSEIERDEGEPECWEPDGEMGGDGDKDESESAEKEGDDEMDEALVLEIAEHAMMVEGEVAVGVLAGFFDEGFVFFDALFHMIIIA